MQKFWSMQDQIRFFLWNCGRIKIRIRLHKEVDPICENIELQWIPDGGSEFKLPRILIQVTHNNIILLKVDIILSDIWFMTLFFFLFRAVQIFCASKDVRSDAAFCLLFELFKCSSSFFGKSNFYPSKFKFWNLHKWL